MPFEAETIAQLKPIKLACDVTLPINASRDCKQLIGWMLTEEESERATVENIVTSEWLLSCDLPDDDVFYKFEKVF